MERIAISGSSGFIAKHLSESLSGQFEKLDRSGFIPPNVDVVFDLSGYGNLYGQNDTAEIYKANLMRVIEEIKYITGMGGKLIYISTSSVTLPKQTEYSLSKKAAEEVLKVYARDRNLKVAIVRPFTIIGVGEQKEHLIPKLIDSCLHGTEMPFVPGPVHDFLDVEDFVGALLSIKENGVFEGEIYQVGSGAQHTNTEVKDLVETLTGRKANLRRVDEMRSYDTKEWRADTTRIRSLGWVPQKSLEDSIRGMIYEKTNTNNK